MKNGNENFAKNLRVLRKSLGLDQADVAHSLGVNSRTYQKYEYGQATPSESKKIKLAELFKVKISDLYKDDVFATEAPLAPESQILKELGEIKSKLATPEIDPLVAKIRANGDDLYEALLNLDALDLAQLRQDLNLPSQRPLINADERIASALQNKDRGARAAKK